jgi:hypothetical protein
MEAPDVVDAKLREVVHKVNVEADEAEDEVDVVVANPDVHVGCDMPMSIYLQPTHFYSSLFVSKLLRSKFQVSFQISKRLKDLI